VSDKYLGMGKDAYEKWYKNSGIPEARIKASKWTAEDERLAREQRIKIAHEARCPSNWK